MIRSPLGTSQGGERGFQFPWGLPTANSRQGFGSFYSVDFQMDKASRLEERRKLFEEHGHLSYLAEVQKREGGFGVVVRAVSQVEELLDVALKKHEKWSVVKDLAEDVDSKIRLARALDIIDSDMYAVMQALRRLRNEVSHEWNAVVDEKRVNELMNAIPSHVRDSTKQLVGVLQRLPLSEEDKRELWLVELMIVVATAVMTVNGKWLPLGPAVT